MKLIKHLTVNYLEMRHRMTGKYVLGLSEPGTWPETESTLTLTVDDLSRFGLDPDEGLVGGTVELTLTVVPFSWETRSPDTVIITHLSRSSEVQHHYSFIPPDKSERRTFRLEAKTPVRGGTLVVLPSTYYELNLSLTEGEYRRVRQLPAATAFQVQVRHVRQHFRDVVLTWRGTLDDPRIFPADYTAHMIPLARAMIAYFDGDVDVVGHYCGLDTEEERERPGEDPCLGTRTWRREYFAVDPLSPDEWEAPFSESVARVETILAERYGNHLPIGSVNEFYDHLETSVWESQKPHPIEELSVGLQARYVFREHYHLPSIVIEARSVGGNRKACQAACETLSREAVALFNVRFDHISWAVEEMREKSELPGQPGQEEPESAEEDEIGDSPAE